jgi:hypothetical protein
MVGSGSTKAVGGVAQAQRARMHAKMIVSRFMDGCTVIIISFSLFQTGSTGSTVYWRGWMPATVIVNTRPSGSA